MSIGTENPLAKWADLTCQIKRMVDSFERFHKHAQLMGSPLFIPILNESRYLARALTDAWSSATSTELTEAERDKCVHDALVKARHAASSALHDTVDEMLAITIKCILGIEEGLKNKGRPPILAMHLDEDWLQRYSLFLKAYRSISTQIADSRARRQLRDDLYVEFMRPSKDDEKTDLEVVLDFFLSLRQLELAVFSVEKAKKTDKNS